MVQWQRQLSPEAPPTEDWRYAFIRDISKGGLGFETNESLAVGDLLYFKVKIHFALWPFGCTGQVIRVRPLENQERPIVSGTKGRAFRGATLIRLLPLSRDRWTANAVDRRCPLTLAPCAGAYLTSAPA